MENNKRTRNNQETRGSYRAKVPINQSINQSINLYSASCKEKAEAFNKVKYIGHKIKEIDKK